jgi:hypothetical protein
MNVRAALLAALLPTAAAAQSYKWTDEHGRVHYTQVPPKAGSYEVIGVPPPPAAAPNQEALNRALEEGLKEEAKSEAAAAKAQQEQARRQEACKRALERVAHLDAQTPRRLSVTDEQGNVARITEEEFARRRAQAQEDASTHCS